MSSGQISLYFTLQKGAVADLEVVATAALEWLEAARAATREIDPGAEIKIDLVDAEEGSLKINTILRFFESHLEQIDKGSDEYPRLRRLAIALAIFVPTTGAQTFSYYLGPPQEVVLRDDDRKLIEENNRLLRGMIEQAHKNPDVEARRQRFFRTLERDKSITGAGLIEGPKDRPILVIPSDQFSEATGLWAIADHRPLHRVVFLVIDVTLISPVLLSKPRSWRFQPEGLPEFSAKMLDSRFLKALESDVVKERLRTGIQMKLRIRAIEERVGELWVPMKRGRSVVEVIEPRIT